MKQKFTLLFGFMFPAGLLVGQWHLLDNFSVGEAADWEVGLHSELGDSFKDVVADPANSSNRVLDFYSDGTFPNTVVSAVLNLPTAIPASQAVATFYYRTYLTGLNVNSFAGVSSKENPVLFPDYRSISRFQRFDSQAGTLLQVYNMGLYETHGQGESSVWYEIWQVLYPATNSYDVYIKGGQWAEQTLLAEGAIFRGNSEAEDILSIMLTNAITNGDGLSLDRALFDDIYMDFSGLNLTPVPEPQHMAFVVGLFASAGLLMRKRMKGSALRKTNGIFFNREMRGITQN